MTRSPTRKAFGEGVAALMRRRGDVVALDGEVGNSTYLEEVLKHTPERYFEVYIAEQMMIAEAVGFQVRGWTPFPATFAAFLSRAYDFIRMAVISQAKLCVNGSHAGVSIGEDGPSQMALEDLAEFRALGELGRAVSVRPQPDGQAGAGDGRPPRDLLHADRRARAWPRSTRPTRSSRSAAPRSCASHADDQVALIGAGVTLHEAIKAADDARRRRDQRPRDRRLLGQAARLRHAGGSVSRDRRPAGRRRGSLGRGRDRRGGHQRLRRHGRPSARGQARRPRAAGLGQGRRAACTRLGSTPTRSPPPRGGWSSSGRKSRPGPALPRADRPSAAPAGQDVPPL